MIGCMALKKLITLTRLKTNFLKNWGYWLSFLLPLLIFLTYFLTKGFDFLTVDLGQQYIDFLAHFKRYLFSDPGKLIYSFSNGLGGSMIATVAYYLTSPFNLLLIFSPNLPIAVLVVISLKISTAGLSSFYYWRHKFNLSQIATLAAAASYSLCGFAVANYLNLMWLDSVILLPILLKQIDNLLTKKSDKLILITFLAWSTNFYTGYMILLFGCLYFIKELCLSSNTAKIELIKKYLWKSILGSFLASFILWPTFLELLAGKASTGAKWSLNFQFPLSQELSKLLPGAYNYSEMEAGMPNIFISSPLFLLAIAYFLNKNILWKKRLADGLLSLIMILSLSFTPLVLVWHMGQFPIWYPGRFSFILSFLLIDLALTCLKNSISLLNKFVLVGLAAGLEAYWLCIHNSFSFINEQTLILAGLFLALSLLYICFIHQNIRFDTSFLAISVLIEISANLILSLNNITYQNNRDYENFSNNMVQISSQLPRNIFFRVEKNFYRSDNDPFTANYYGISIFNSVSDQKTLTLLSQLGYLHNSNSVTNNGGSPISDAILGIKYYIEPNYAHDQIKANQQMRFDNLNNRVDLINYPVEKEYPQLLLLKNNFALPLIFLDNNDFKKVHFISDNPLYNQQLLLQKMIGTSADFIDYSYLPKLKTQNALAVNTSSLEFQKSPKVNNAKIIFELTIKDYNDYYLQLPMGISPKNANLIINGRSINLDIRDDQSRLINIINHKKGEKVSIVFEMLNNELNLNELKLWKIDTNKLAKSLIKFNQKQPSFKQTSAFTLKANFKTTTEKTLASTVPYSKNWLIFDNGKLISSKLIFNAFLGGKLDKGHHQLLLVYLPINLIIGLFLSLISLVLIKLHKD